MQIPYTYGKYYNVSQHSTKKECLSDVKKLGLNKNQYIIKEYIEIIKPSFLTKLFNKKAKAKKIITYALYKKD